MFQASPFSPTLKFCRLGALLGVDTDRVSLPGLVNALQLQAVVDAPGAGLLDDGRPEH